MNPTASIVIATRNRPQALDTTLRTLLAQSQIPVEAIIVDSSEGNETAQVAARYAAQASFAIRYIHVTVPSAAGQRNRGVELATGDIVVFMDDDVELDRAFLEELLVPFEGEQNKDVGGVCGLITNQCYVPPSALNAILLGWIMGDRSGKWAGRVVGPAVNFLPADIPSAVQPVEWLNTGGTAYRRSILLEFPFGSHFEGYSFGEDLDLSTRIGRSYRLLNTTKARYYHHDLGQATHKNWVAIGLSSVLNRYRILTNVLRRDSLEHRIRFFLFEIPYGALAALVSSRLRPARLSQFALLFLGKIRAFWIIWTGAKGERTLV